MNEGRAVALGGDVHLELFKSTGRPGKSPAANGIVEGRRYRSGLPMSGGVYVLVDGDGSPVYVGISGDMNRRCRQHKYPHANVLFHPCSHEEALWAEVVLVSTLEPKFNTKLRGNLNRNKRARPPALEWIPRAALLEGSP